MKFYVTNVDQGKTIEDEGEKYVYSFDQLLAIARKYESPIIITPPEMECDFNAHNLFPTLLIADDYLG